jgi:hypothetical protein
MHIHPSIHPSIHRRARSSASCSRKRTRNGRVLPLVRALTYSRRKGRRDKKETTPLNPPYPQRIFTSCLPVYPPPPPHTPLRLQATHNPKPTISTTPIHLNHLPHAPLRLRRQVCSNPSGLGFAAGHLHRALGHPRRLPLLPCVQPFPPLFLAGFLDFCDGILGSGSQSIDGLDLLIARPPHRPTPHQPPQTPTTPPRPPHQPGGVLSYLRKEGYIKLQDEDTYLDEVVGIALAGAGFYFQTTMAWVRRLASFRTVCLCVCVCSPPLASCVCIRSIWTRASTNPPPPPLPPYHTNTRRTTATALPRQPPPPAAHHPRDDAQLLRGQCRQLTNQLTYRPKSMGLSSVASRGDWWWKPRSIDSYESFVVCRKGWGRLMWIGFGFG